MNATHEQLIGTMREKSTEDLLAIWETNDRSRWSDDTFQSISQVLVERGCALPSQSPPLAAASEYKGVGGWLRWLCIVLVAGIPLRILSELGAQGLSANLLIVGPALLLSAFSIYAGVALWRVAPGAVKKVKAFMWTNLVVNLLGVAVLVASGNFRSSDLGQAVGSFATFCIWYSYLSTSRRVAATYIT